MDTLFLNNVLQFHKSEHNFSYITILLSIILPTTQSRIQKIILAHQALMIAYNKILSSVEIENFTIKYKFLEVNPLKQLKSKKLNWYQKIQLFGFFSNYIFNIWQFVILIRFYVNRPKKRINFEFLSVTVTERVNRLLLEFLLKTHYHRQLNQVYNLYLREILSQSQRTTDEKDVDELRKIASDTKNYLEKLPSAKKTIVTIAAFATGIIVGIEFLGLRELILSTSIPFIEQYALGVLVISYFIGFLISKPLISAFRTKRTLFLDTKSRYHYLDQYLGEEKALYEKSIYKLEDNLFNSLDANNRKLREIPIDKIALMIIASGVFIVTGSLFISIMIEDPSKLNEYLEFENLIRNSILAGLFGFWLFAIPIIEYRRRKIHNLL